MAKIEQKIENLQKMITIEENKLKSLQVSLELHREQLAIQLKRQELYQAKKKEGA